MYDKGLEERINNLSEITGIDKKDIRRVVYSIKSVLESLIGYFKNITRTLNMILHHEEIKRRKYAKKVENRQRLYNKKIAKYGKF